MQQGVPMGTATPPERDTSLLQGFSSILPGQDDPLC